MYETKTVFESKDEFTKEIDNTIHTQNIGDFTICEVDDKKKNLEY